ncbi:hypothetical protein [Oscillibacter sp. MSJ-31]|jgi:hypothetical protein|uniref:hypothetical protein n=1 Tax=Oscillibacter sp. MSJ-31 TaxID=2841526 RepID=UPI001C117B25|nr:hypothetical protein [Oscillibacter sp. MSJ-31]MBU5456532.1 hypothetical protein [Oscillibacter sp. MSJ-31]
MSLLDLFKQPQPPAVQTILPNVAVHEIMNGRLPILNTDKLFLKSGETCHYIDKAIYEKKTTRKRYVRRNSGYSTPGLFKGTRVILGGGTTDQVDNVTYQTLRGVLYITNRRIIFQGEQEGFDLKVDDLIAITPYSNCVELQTSKAHYKIFVPNGNVAHTVLRLIR